MVVDRHDKRSDGQSVPRRLDKRGVNFSTDLLVYL